MDTIIQSLGFKAGEKLESFIKNKLEELKSGDIVRANVTLYKGSAGNPDNDYCEIRLEVPGNDHFVKKHNSHFETAASECVEVLSQMIQKSKSKHVGNRKADAIGIQDEIIKAEEDSDTDDVELEDVVK